MEAGGAGGRENSSAGDRRREAMIEAAYRLFMERGYGSVSVDDVIREAGGSKATLYKFFGNKEGLMRAVVESLADKMLREIDVQFPSGHSVRESLLRIGSVLVELALSDNAIGQQRQAIANARAFPDVSRIWFESGPKRTMDGVAAFLELETRAGRLRVKDPQRAAWFFCSMVIFKENFRRVIGARPAAKADLKETVVQAVDVFLAAYGA